ncbi:MAG: hypothetical protein A2W85_09765 [Bacteroidetes bacterium GWF2_41_31]|nr:MAG: hypothetical protein A2W85_09765 [Bacteroidetes bacterium GWF2_41_31]
MGFWLSFFIHAYLLDFLPAGNQELHTDRIFATRATDVKVIEHVFFVHELHPVKLRYGAGELAFALLKQALENVVVISTEWNGGCRHLVYDWGGDSSLRILRSE